MVKRARILSGVAVVAVMTPPHPCPHGRCIYCPGGDCVPQSYVDESPAVIRARRVSYDPYLQVKERLEQFRRAGFFPSKVELIVMGGTFTSMPEREQEIFITRCFDAMNDFPSSKEVPSRSVEEAHARNEKALCRCTVLTIETRPDWALPPQIDLMLRLGATRVEIGVQSIYEDVLGIIRRGHGVEVVKESTRFLRDAGYKVCYHLMPGLPGSDLDRDIRMFREIFSDEHYRPDMLKIYPTLVIKGTELYDMWRRGEYRPLSEEEFMELLEEIYRILPKWVRVQHVQRDIPASRIEAGPKRRNIRQLVEEKLMREGVGIREIRFREVGRAHRRGVPVRFDHAEITEERYSAGEGTEIFLSVEDREMDVLFGVLRLRIPSKKAHRWEVCGNTALIREVHVYGPQIPVGEMPTDIAAQHRGFGRMLMKRAEEIAFGEYRVRRILVISGVGAREYFRRLGYRRMSGSFYMYKDRDGAAGI